MSRVNILLGDKYLMVAAYLASVNWKEIDDGVFAGRRKGKTCNASWLFVVTRKRTSRRQR